MKNKTAAIILALILAAGVAFLYHMGCGISLFAKVKTGEGSSTHSEADILEAISIVRKEFRNLSGCFMTEIRYSEEKTQQELAEKREYGFIVLESTFTTSKHFSSITFNGVTQRNYNWIITHTEADGWQFCTAGYA